MPFELRNVRLYRLFTIGFNARFYYPVLTILFLDLGLSLSQFVTLNAIWAATIFLAEVPSGALADIIGRKKLLVSSAVLMIAEMACLVFAPIDGGAWLFTLCVINRVLSGLAEAAASGADEALAYDSLEEKGLEDKWDDVLASVMRWRSVTMVFALLLGAASYDPKSVNWIISAFGGSLQLTQDTTLRFPMILCLAQALFTLAVALRFRDLHGADSSTSFREVLARTLKAARWVFTTRAALLVVLGALILDALARNFATISSEYYRMIEIPEFAFGLIATIASLMGLALPSLFKYLVRRFSPLVNFSIAGAWIFLGLLALAPAVPFWGIIPAPLIMAALGFVGFLTSRYLNALTSSHQRATVLSVKGLLLNLSYGTASLAFAGYVSFRENAGGLTEVDSFRSALWLQPWVFLVALIGYLITARAMRLPKSLSQPNRPAR